MVELYILCGKKESEENIIFIIEESDALSDMILTRKAQNIFKELKPKYEDITRMQAIFIARSEEQKIFAREKFKKVNRY